MDDLDKVFRQIFGLRFGRIATLDTADVHCITGAHEQCELHRSKVRNYKFLTVIRTHYNQINSKNTNLIGPSNPAQEIIIIPAYYGWHRRIVLDEGDGLLFHHVINDNASTAGPKIKLT